MREQIRRILGLVASGRLSVEDAAPLLAALHPMLALKPEALEPLLKLAGTEDFGPNRVTEMLMSMVFVQEKVQQIQSQRGNGQQSQSQAATSAARPSATFKIGGTSYPLDDLGDAITSRVEEALGGLLGRGSRPPRPGTILKIETEDENGGSFSANLPLSLASHAERLIPPHAQKALERSGLTIEAIKLLLQAGPPPGKLLEAEDENGNSVKLSIQ